VADEETIQSLLWQVVHLSDMGHIYALGKQKIGQQATSPNSFIPSLPVIRTAQNNKL
jgi:hypothetical protein